MSEKRQLVRRRVYIREEREIPIGSNFRFDVGLALITSALGFVVAGISVDPVPRAVLLAAAACFAVGAAGCFLPRHNVNRGRCLKETELFEEFVE